MTWPINTGFVAARWLMIHTRTDVTESVYVAVWLILVGVALLNSVTALRRPKTHTNTSHRYTCIVVYLSLANTRRGCVAVEADSDEARLRHRRRH